MSKPYVPTNEVQGALTSDFVHATDNHLHLVSAADFDTGGGFIRVQTTDGAHWALYEYTAVSTNDLTGLTPCTLGVVETDAAYTFPTGAYVYRVCMGEDIAERIMGPASATDNQVVLFDGTTGKKVKAAAASSTTTHALFATAGAPEFRAIASTDLGACITQAATTLYVAKTGNDGNAGTAGSPKLTIGGALDALPFILAHACTINVAPGEYDEILTTKLQKFMIPASLTIEAKDTADRVWHARGTVVSHDTDDVGIEEAHITADNDWQNALVTLYGPAADAAAGQIRTVSSSTHAGHNLVVASVWDTHPTDATTTYVLWGAVRIDGETTSPVNCSGLRNVTFKGIGFKASGASSTSFVAQLLSAVVLEDCGSIDETYGIQIKDASTAQLSYCSCLVPTSGYGFMVNGASYSGVTGCVAYGAKSGDYGFYITNGSIVGFSAAFPNQARHLGTGVYGLNGGQAFGLTGMVYTDNTTNANPDTPTTTAELVADGLAFIQDQT